VDLNHRSFDMTTVKSVTIDLRPMIEKVFRELLRPLEDKVKKLERKVKEQEQQIEQLKGKA
jgi:hypothetical protein